MSYAGPILSEFADSHLEIKVGITGKSEVVLTKQLTGVNTIGGQNKVLISNRSTELRYAIRNLKTRDSLRSKMGIIGSTTFSSLRRHIIRGASSDRLLADGRGERNSIHFRITASMRQNDVVNATWYDAARVRYSIPVNAHKPSWSTEAYLSGYQALDKQQYWRLMFSGRVLYSTSMSYQPVSLFTNNIWDAPAVTRVVAQMNSFWNMIFTVASRESLRLMIYVAPVK